MSSSTTLSESIFDYSKTISDNEFTTNSKIKTIVDSLNIEKLNPIIIEPYIFQDYVVLLPKKSIFFAVTVYGGGSSGIKTDYESSIAFGGVSSGIIVRFPIDVNNEGETYLIQVRAGLGGKGFHIDEANKVNNGEFSTFDLYGVEKSDRAPYYKNEEIRKKNRVVESLSAYGGGVLLDNSFTQDTSTKSYFGFNGSNPSNTTPVNVENKIFDHRNFYAPYLSTYNGYNSFIGLGGLCNGTKTQIDAEINSGAGGAGVNDRTINDFVGAGGNGGVFIEYEGMDKMIVYVKNYLFVSEYDNKITFVIYDKAGFEQDCTLNLEYGIYAITSLVAVIKSFLNQYTDANVVYEAGKLVIKMQNQWSIRPTLSSGNLIVDLGIMGSDIVDSKTNMLIKSKIVENYHTIAFSGLLLDVCLRDNIYNYRIF
jgi:hypothetical protein